MTSYLTVTMVLSHLILTT